MGRASGRGAPGGAANRGPGGQRLGLVLVVVAVLGMVWTTRPSQLDTTPEQLPAQAAIEVCLDVPRLRVGEDERGWAVLSEAGGEVGGTVDLVQAEGLLRAAGIDVRIHPVPVDPDRIDPGRIAGGGSGGPDSAVTVPGSVLFPLDGASVHMVEVACAPAPGIEPRPF